MSQPPSPVALNTNLISVSTPGKTIHAIKFLYLVSGVGLFSTALAFILGYAIMKTKYRSSPLFSVFLLIATGIAIWCMQFYLKHYAAVKGAYNKIYVQRRFGSTVTIVQGLNSNTIAQYNDLVRAGKMSS